MAVAVLLEYEGKNFAHADDLDRHRPGTESERDFSRRFLMCE